uniref:C2H2-type domain-containing protein n=1 Tax=Anopheles culicifacies TaxID=139723 RepID=A0A182MFG6_9DIPT
MFIKPGIDYCNNNGANVSTSGLDQDLTREKYHHVASGSNNYEESDNMSPSCRTKRTGKKAAEQTGRMNKRNAHDDRRLASNNVERHVDEKHGNFSQKRFRYSRIKQEDEDDEVDDQFDFHIKPSTSSNTSTVEQSSYRTSSSCEDEPNNYNPPNLKGTRRTRAKKTKPEPSTPSEEESDHEDDFLKTVTLKSLTERFQYEKPHKCSRKGCPYKFASFDIRDQHLRCHAESDPIPESTDGSAKAGVPRKRFSFKCSQCDGKFDSWKPCLMHVWREHQIDLGMLRCPVCEKRFVYTVHVFKHLQTHRLNQAVDISCRICGKKFVNTSQRSVHEALHRKEETYEYEDELEEKPRWYAKRRCNICKHMFSNSKILSKHIKTVHLKIKPFVCNVCGYKCARKATLNIHIRQHSGLKPLACKSCTFRTADPSALSYHERRHRNERAYQCKTCGIKVVQPSALRCHIQSQHPQEYQQMKCTLCDYASINAQNLKRHQANHKAGLIRTKDEDSQLECDNEQDIGHRVQHGLGMGATVNGSQPQHAPEISFDCFLPLESVDSVVHDTGGITIPAAVISLPAALSEETQFPI